MQVDITLLLADMPHRQGVMRLHRDGTIITGQLCGIITMLRITMGIAIIIRVAITPVGIVEGTTQCTVKTGLH